MRLPGPVPENIVAGGFRKAVAPRRVGQQSRHCVGKTTRIVGDHKMVARCGANTLIRNRRRDDRFAHRHEFNQFILNASTDLRRIDTDGRPDDIIRGVRHFARDRHSVQVAQRDHFGSWLAADNEQLRPRLACADQRPDIFSEPGDRVNVRIGPEHAVEHQRERLFLDIDARRKPVDIDAVRAEHDIV